MLLYLTSAAALLSLATAKPLSTAPMGGNNMKARSMMLAPLFAPPPQVAHNAINDSYIVILKPDAVVSDHVLMAQDAHTASPLDSFTGGIRHVYDSVHIKGYSGRFSPTAVKRLRGLPEVAYIEQDQLVHAVDIETQKSSPWGLARISHRSKLTLSTFTKYEYDPSGGEGVDVYVIDTGININHKEFQGRARWGKTVPTDASDVDNNGHGTHCAGTIASAAYGVAKKAHVIAVKVLGDNGSGSMADVVGGVVWASEQAQEKLKEAQAEFRATGKSAHKGSVANMSLGGGKSNALDQVVNAAVEAGLHMAVAAGNDNRDACSYSPAAAENAVTVGASTLSDQRAYFSNFGSCVDIFAPGLNILSTWIGSDTARNSISGTSMASPHTAGLLAYLLSLYPSKRFDPFNEAGIFNLDAQLNHEQTALMAALEDAKPAFLLNWLPYIPGGKYISKLLHRQVVAPAPVPGGPGSITPLQLKKALIALGTRGALEEDSLGKNSPNVLIFNNATDSSSY